MPTAARCRTLSRLLCQARPPARRGTISAGCLGRLPGLRCTASLTAHRRGLARAALSTLGGAGGLRLRQQLVVRVGGARSEALICVQVQRDSQQLRLEQAQRAAQGQAQANGASGSFLSTLYWGQEGSMSLGLQACGLLLTTPWAHALGPGPLTCMAPVPSRRQAKLPLCCTLQKHAQLLRRAASSASQAGAPYAGRHQAAWGGWSAGAVACQAPAAGAGARSL